MRSRNRPLTLILLASVFLAGVLAYELMAGPFFIPEAVQEAHGPRDLADAPIVSREERPDLAAFAEVTARPLFSPSRRPYESGEEPKAAAVPKTETFDLIGVIISPAERTALLRPKASNEVLRVIEGQSVGGWEVRAIEPAQVTLGQGSGDKNTTVLVINEKRKKFAGSPQAIRQSKQSNEANPQQQDGNSPQQDSGATEITEEPTLEE